MGSGIRLSRHFKTFYAGAGIWAGIAGGAIAISVGQFLMAAVLFVVGVGIILLIVTGRYLGARKYTSGDLLFLSVPVVVVVIAVVGALSVFPRASLLILYVGVYLGLILLAVIAQLVAQPQPGSFD